MLITTGHKTVRRLGLTALVGLALTISGCIITFPPPPPSGTVPPPTPTAGTIPPPTPTTATASATDDYRAIETELCETLRAEVEQALNVTVTQEEDVAFATVLDNRSGVSCRLTATGTGEDFTNFLDVANNLVALLEAQGWTPDPQYVADAPTGTVLGLRRDDDTVANGLAVVQVNWKPAPGVECPQDQPIATCAEQLEPTEMLYNISIDLAETG
jgi:hypothetical protein